MRAPVGSHNTSLTFIRFFIFIRYCMLLCGSPQWSYCFLLDCYGFFDFWLIYQRFFDHRLVVLFLFYLDFWISLLIYRVFNSFWKVRLLFLFSKFVWFEFWINWLFAFIQIISCIVSSSRWKFGFLVFFSCLLNMCSRYFFHNLNSFADWRSTDRLILLLPRFWVFWLFFNLFFNSDCCIYAHI